MTTEVASTPPNAIPTSGTVPLVGAAQPSRLRRIFRSFWTRLLLLGLIFCAGGITGVSMTLLWTQGQQQQMIQNPRPRPEWVSQRLKSSLELTEEQMPAVEKVMRQHHEALEKIRQQVAPLYLAVFDQMDQEIQSLLETDKQREVWKKKAADMRIFWATGRMPPGSRSDRGRRGGDSRSGDARSGDARSGEDRKGSDRKPEDHKHEERKSDERKQDAKKPDETKRPAME